MRSGSANRTYPRATCYTRSMPAIGPRQSADLPERTQSFWRLAGPGAVLVGLSIGAGEIVIWPRLAAAYGATLLWAAALGVLLQLVVNIEVGRLAIATGETPYTAFARLWRPFAVFFIAFNFFGWYFPGWARVSGAALKALCFSPEHASPDWVWTAVTFAGVAGVLFGSNRVYAIVEKLIGALVVLVIVGLAIIAFRVGTWADVREVLAGVVCFGKMPTEEQLAAHAFTVKDLFIAIVFAGAGGTANLFYAFYLRDKQVGMGARVPALVNPFRGRAQAESGSGYDFPDTRANHRRFRDWFRFVVLDQVVFFWLLNTLTIFLFVFGALVVLHPRGIVPGEGTLIWDEAHILAETMGRFGRYLFLLIGVATLFSTQVTLVDGVSRSMADIIHTSLPAAQRWSEATWYAAAAMFMIGFGVIITIVLEAMHFTSLGFLFNAAYVGGFAMAMYTPMLLYVNLRHLPRSARPAWVSVCLLILTSGVYVGFAVFCLMS